MSTTEAIGAESVEATIDERAEFVKGLRDVADLIESNPDVPVPSWAIVQRSAYTNRLNREEFIAGVRALDIAPKIKGPEIVARRKFAGDVSFTIEAKTDDVCDQREVTTTETRNVLPPELGGEVVESR